MRLYRIVKMFVLAFMLVVYILFLLTIAAAHYAGGWVVVLVDRYHEGMFEIVLLASILPLAAYVTFREIYQEIKGKRI